MCIQYMVTVAHTDRKQNFERFLFVFTEQETGSFRAWVSQVCYWTLHTVTSYVFFYANHKVDCTRKKGFMTSECS